MTSFTNLFDKQITNIMNILLDKKRKQALIFLSKVSRYSPIVEFIERKYRFASRAEDFNY